jgi:hypothetical protein
MVDFAKDIHVLSNTKILILVIRETQFLEKGTESVLSWWIRIQIWIQIRKNSMKISSYNMINIFPNQEKENLCENV